MRGLGSDIRSALDTIIEGLEYDVYANGEDLDQDRMDKIMKAKVTSFNSAKKILMRWQGSRNAPPKKVMTRYMRKLVKAADFSLDMLRVALRESIDYEFLEEHKHNAAISAKASILEYLFDMESGIREVREKLETGDYDLRDKEFKLGYPERFAKGEIFSIDNYFKNWYNEDEDAVRLCPFGTEGERIEISGLNIILPAEPEDKTKILFHDLPKEDQYWRRQPEPKITHDNIDEWDDYIMEEYKRRVEGVWFYNNGKPTYLTGNAYYALQWGKMFDNGDYMQFRHAQLKMFYHLQAVIVDSRALGEVFLKSRRTGFTYIVLFILLNTSTMTRNGKYGMMSKSSDDIEEAFAKFSYAFLSLPFWLRPVVKNKMDSPKELFFSKPSDNTKESKKLADTGVGDYLNTLVDYRPTKDGSYDSVKLNGYLLDEAAKYSAPVDLIRHMGMVGPTMMPNGRVVGKMFAGSTMGAYNKGGEQFIEVIEGSFVKDRDPITKKTRTALYFHFLPAQDNMEEFTDKYGKCWTTKPPDGTLNVLQYPITMGSEEYLVAIEEQKRKQSDKAYAEQIRTYPRTIEHAMRDDSDETVFNMVKLEEQMEYNRVMDDDMLYQIGNFEWKDGIKDSDVVFIPRSDGRFYVSWLPTAANGMQGFYNHVIRKGENFYPGNENQVYLACDPFSFTIGDKGSNGAIHGITSKYPQDGIPLNSFVIEYIARPEDIIFFEDVIKVCRYYGSKILIESNRIDLNRHLLQRGYRAFAENRIDKMPEKLNDKEKKYGGQPIAGKDIIAAHMDAVGMYIENYVGIYTNEELKLRDIGQMGNMVFNRTLRDWMRFNPKTRTKHDAFVSSGLAIMYQSKERYRGQRKRSTYKSVAGLVKKYRVRSGGIGRRLVKK